MKSSREQISYHSMDYLDYEDLERENVDDIYNFTKERGINNILAERKKENNLY